jgi:hypothetical protein
MKKNDLDPSFSIEDLIEIVVNLNQKVLDLESRETTWRKDVQDSHDAKYQLQTKIDELSRQHKVLQSDRANELDAKVAAYKLAVKFGGHQSDCAYIEAASCGRIMRGGEEKICNCGWCETQKTIKEQLKQ